MSIKELVYANRSYRRFDENHEITQETLRQLVDLARMSPNGGNQQSLRYVLVTGEVVREQVFSCLGFAKLLTDWHGPEKGERPTAYILILNDTTVCQSALAESGIAAQSILLGAVEQQLGGCMFRNINKKKLQQLFSLPETLDILMVLAIGKPKETIQIDEVKQDGNTNYWRDENGVHHLPKHKLEDIIFLTEE